MKKEDITPYIQSLLADMNVEDAEKEVQPMISATLAYMAGLEHKEFPIGELTSTNLDIKQFVPEQFHTLVAQMAVLRGGKGGRVSDDLYKNCEKLANELGNYFRK